MSGFFTDILGTLRTTFRVGNAIHSSVGLTALRTFTLPDVNGTVALTSQLNGFAPISTASLLFGTGADGNATISSGTVTLTRDMHYANLTLSGSGSINCNGWRLFVSGTLDISSAGTKAIFPGDAGPGFSGSGSAAGVGGYYSGYGASSPREYGSPPTGGSGTTGTGGAGSSAGAGATSNLGSPAPAGAQGGAGTSPAGAPGGAVSSNTLKATSPSDNLCYSAGSGAQLFSSAYPASGSAGGGDGTNQGGGGGGAGGGGCGLIIRARFINRGTNTATGIFVAKGNVGGNGGTPNAGNTGGGAGANGGNGGYVDIMVELILGSTISGAIDVSGSQGGNGGNGQGTGKGGTGGTGGYSGVVALKVLSTPSATFSTYVASSPATTATTITGTAGSAGATQLVNL